jgi:cell filamentation protein
VVGDRYQFDEDPGCYPGTTVLINLPGLQDQESLDHYEIERVGERSLQNLPEGKFDPKHYRSLHRHLFCDVYTWAGEYRTVVTWKGTSRFAQPGFIPNQMDKTFARLQQPEFLPNSDVDAFIIEAAEFLGDVNHIHPFREGNGRTQLVFMRLLGQRAGHQFRSESVEADEFLAAMIASYSGEMGALIDELERMLA